MFYPLIVSPLFSPPGVLRILCPTPHPASPDPAVTRCGPSGLRLFSCPQLLHFNPHSSPWRVQWHGHRCAACDRARADVQNLTDSQPTRPRAYCDLQDHTQSMRCFPTGCGGVTVIRQGTRKGAPTNSSPNFDLYLSHFFPGNTAFYPSASSGTGFRPISASRQQPSRFLFHHSIIHPPNTCGAPPPLCVHPLFDAHHIPALYSMPSSSAF